MQQPIPFTLAETAFDPKSLIGKQLREAKIMAGRSHISIRVTKQDGHSIEHRADHQEGRYNYTVASGRITEYCGEY